MIECVYRDYPKLYEGAFKTRHIRYNQTLDELETLKRQGKCICHSAVGSGQYFPGFGEKNKRGNYRDLYQLGYEDAKKHIRRNWYNSLKRMDFLVNLDFLSGIVLTSLSDYRIIGYYKKNESNRGASKDREQQWLTADTVFGRVIRRSV